ncbi:hypothetical protein [Jiella sp. M17.18]|uniref:hypothetical protein n=1 Tax=Jiella sp. M17.18 TaxID=3234247 RepID=UPI0034DE1B4D
MTSDTNRSPASDKARDDLSKTSDRLGQEAGSARHEAKAAADSARHQAENLAGTAKERAYEGADQGKETVAGSLDDFAAAIGKAADELGERDQSMAASLVREMATGLGDASRSIHGRSVDEIVRSVAGFARSRPTTFLVGAALAGVALGRFARASGEHEHGGYAGSGASRQPHRPDRAPAAPRDYARSYAAQPRPSEAAYPRDREPVTARPQPVATPSTTVGSKPATTPSTTTPSGGNHGR